MDRSINSLLKNAKEFSTPKEEASFDCECLKCRHKMTSDKHCRDFKCPKCGGEMRRTERPGVGASKRTIKALFDEKKPVVKNVGRGKAENEEDAVEVTFEKPSDDTKEEINPKEIDEEVKEELEDVKKDLPHPRAISSLLKKT